MVIYKSFYTLCSEDQGLSDTAVVKLAMTMTGCDQYVHEDWLLKDCDSDNNFYIYITVILRYFNLVIF